MSKRIAIEDLSCASVDVKPIDYSWDPGGYGDAWDYREAARCEKCGLAVLGSGGGDKHSDCEPDTDCDGYVPPCEGPMISFWYPIELSDIDEAARTIVDLPLCVVTVGDETGLALTGGGMDLSWEICEAYMRLGDLPPAHFRLPAMCSRGTSQKDYWIAEGSIKACEVVAGWMRSRIEETRRVLKLAEDRENKREVRT